MNEKQVHDLAVFIESLYARTTFTPQEVKAVMMYLRVLLALARRLGGDWEAK